MRRCDGCSDPQSFPHRKGCPRAPPRVEIRVDLARHAEGSFPCPDAEALVTDAKWVDHHYNIYYAWICLECRRFRYRPESCGRPIACDLVIRVSA